MFFEILGAPLSVGHDHPYSLVVGWKSLGLGFCRGLNQRSVRGIPIGTTRTTPRGSLLQHPSLWILELGVVESPRPPPRLAVRCERFTGIAYDEREETCCQCARDTSSHHLRCLHMQKRQCVAFGNAAGVVLLVACR